MDKLSSSIILNIETHFIIVSSYTLQYKMLHFSTVADDSFYHHLPVKLSAARDVMV